MVDDVGGTVENVVGPSIVVVDVKEPHSETKKRNIEFTFGFVL